MKTVRTMALVSVLVLSLFLSACMYTNYELIDNKIEPETENTRYEEFMAKAEDIERYSKEHYETATTQTDINIESYNVYKKWDGLLNEVYQHLKSVMSPEEFADLETEELRWIDEKEKAMEEAAKEWAGGSGEAMARNSAGIEYTRKRCYALISLLK